MGSKNKVKKVKKIKKGKNKKIEKKSAVISKTRLTKALPFIDLLTKASDTERISALNFLNEEGVEVVCQCVHNSLSNIDVDAKERANLACQMKDCSAELRYVTNPTRKAHLKKNKLIQIGGKPNALSVILKTAFPLLYNFLLPPIVQKEFNL
jgi:hypothetical protein